MHLQLNQNKPKILISKCLEFDSCRYDGQIIHNKFIQKLKNHVDFITICPEVEIGLGTPRDPINLIHEKNKKILYQSSTNKDLTNEMMNFTNNYLKKIKKIDGIILKSKSPSCGIKTTKIFSNKKLNKSIKNGSGLFSYYLIKKFPNIPIIEDMELNEISLRNQFYSSIFILCDFRNIITIKQLYDFHEKHKLQMMSRNQLDLKKMGKVAANHENKTLKQTLNDYFDLLLKILKKKPTNGSHVNTQMHAFGYYKNHLSKKDKLEFLNLLDNYKKNNEPITNILNVFNNWNMKFENEYLLNQSYFMPYPKELI